MKVKQPSKKATYVDRKVTPVGVQFQEFVDLTGENQFELRRYDEDHPELGGHFTSTISALRISCIDAAKRLSKTHPELPKGHRFRAVMSESKKDGNVFYLAFHPVPMSGEAKTASKPKKAVVKSKKTASKQTLETNPAHTGEASTTPAE